jgi:hypothetical protein
LNRIRYRLFRHAIALQFILLALTFIPVSVTGQLNAGGMPASLTWNADRSLVPVVDLPPPDFAEIAKEDAASGMPYRFAVNLPCDIFPGSAEVGRSFPTGAGYAS